MKREKDKYEHKLNGHDYVDDGRVTTLSVILSHLLNITRSGDEVLNLL